MKKLYLILATTLFLGACATTRTSPAPIVNGTNPQATNPIAATPVASSGAPKSAPAAVDSSSNVGDTSSSTTVSKVTDDEDGTVVSNSTTPPATQSKTATAAKPATAAVATETAVAGAATLGGINWATPTSGKVVQPYTAASKGVDVLGKEGQSVVAAYDGTVAYSGNGLKGYGNLVIIKHNNGYLTAYSHNKINVVKEGDKVKRGQKIAELGKTESDRPLLHFELRKNGKPMDPTPIFKQ